MTRSPNRRYFPPVLIVLALVALGLITWRVAVRDHLVPRNFGTVETGRLYRSASLTPAAARRVVEANGIRTIVDLGGFDKDPVGEQVAARTAEALGVRRYVFNLEGDGTGDPNAYVAALRVIDDPRNWPVLVHCSAGAERTSGCVMLYWKILADPSRSIEETYPGSADYHHSSRRNPRLRNYIDAWAEAIEAAFRRGEPVYGYPLDEEAMSRGGAYYDRPVPKIVPPAIPERATGAGSEPGDR